RPQGTAPRMGQALSQPCAQDQSRSAGAWTGLQSAGDRIWRTRQVDPPKAPDDSEGVADHRAGWPDADPQPQAWRAVGSRMAWPIPYSDRDGRWLRVCR